MKKQNYQQPAIQAVEMQQTSLLTESNEIKTSRTGYGKANEDGEVPEEELDENGTWTWE